MAGLMDRLEATSERASEQAEGRRGSEGGHGHAEELGGRRCGEGGDAIIRRAAAARRQPSHGRARLVSWIVLSDRDELTSSIHPPCWIAQRL